MLSNVISGVEFQVWILTQTLLKPKVSTLSNIFHLSRGRWRYFLSFFEQNSLEICRDSSTFERHYDLWFSSSNYSIFFKKSNKHSWSNNIICYMNSTIEISLVHIQLPLVSLMSVPRNWRSRFLFCKFRIRTAGT